jgi:hypothetical protein
MHFKIDLLMKGRGLWELDRLCNKEMERITHGWHFLPKFSLPFCKKKRDPIPFPICSPLGQALDPF